MFKFLRKYNKVLLAVFGVLLMITFLIPEAIQRFGQSAGSGAAMATVNGEKVSASKWMQVQNEVQFLQRLGATFPGATAQQVKPEHWYLLSREAEEAGLVAIGEAVDLPEESLLQIVNMTGQRDVGFIRNTVAKLNGVSAMMNLYQSTGALSDRHLKQAAETLLGQVVAQVVVIQAEEDSSFQPSAEAISTHFEKYADVEPGAGEDGFGYRLPDRVKLEWLRVAADSVREVVRTSEQFSPVQQRLHWKRFENDLTKRFPKVEVGAIPEVVANDLLEQLTREKLDEIARYASDQLRLNRRGVPELDGYVVLPDDWQQRQLKLAQLAQDIQARFGVELPAYQSQGEEWMPVSEVAMLEGIGPAMTDRFGAPMPLSQLVQSAREFKSGNAVGSVFIQKDVAGPPLKGADGSVYVFRIIDADAARRPNSVDEVREQVVADLQRVEAFGQLVAKTSQIEQQAEADGMLAVAIANDTHVQPPATLSLTNRWMLQMVQQGMPASVMPSSLPVIGSHRKAVEAVLEYAAGLPKDKTADELGEEQRVLVVPVPEKQALLVFRLVRINPVSQEDYAEVVQSGALQQLVGSENATGSNNAETMEKVFGLDALVKRNNFNFLRTRAEEEEAIETASR